MNRKLCLLFIISVPILFLTGCVRQSLQSIQPVASPSSVASIEPTSKSLVERLPSPNGEYEALSIVSEKSLIYADKQVNFIPGSNNIWLFEKKTQDYTQITEHLDFVSRENILWTQDNRLIFSEGDSTVTEYNPVTKKKKTLLGPDGPLGTCVDACSYDITFVTSPHKQYYIKLFGGLNEANTPIEWVNLDTGVTGKAEGQYEFSIDEINFTSENQFTIPSRTVQDSGIYGSPDLGQSKKLTIIMK